MKEIKVISNYTKEEVKRFLNYYYFDRIKYPRIIVNILIIILIINFFYQSNITVKDLTILVISLFGVIELNTSLLPNINYKKMLKDKNSVIDTKVCYTFREKDFKIETDKIEALEYNLLKKVVETPTAYYLYINSSKAFIVNKDSITPNDITLLTKLLKEKVSTYKYIKNVR